MLKKGMTRKRNKERSDNRIAILGITVVVIFLAIAVHIRSITLHEQDRNYALQEESLDAEIANEQHHSEELQKQKVYVKTKEYTMEKAREIFGLKLPDEVIIKPEQGN
ncbi:MAG TPA: septum formation initiator [Oribacterium sp.]|jgi:cell division protein DivIC|nr:septum formation initiator [Oribacterium sp.]